MFAIVKTGGKQYRVSPGDQILVERIAGGVGTIISLEQVLAISNADASAIGRPTVPNASVRAKIVQQPRGTKVIVFKKKRRKNYRRKRGHRQELTVLRIEHISSGSTPLPEGGLPGEQTTITEDSGELQGGA